MYSFWGDILRKRSVGYRAIPSGGDLVISGNAIAFIGYLKDNRIKPRWPYVRAPDATIAA